MSAGLGNCAKCSAHGYVMPLHGEKGGPMLCPLCCGTWHGEHGKRRKYGRIVIKAIQAFVEVGGGKWTDVDKLKATASASMIKALFGGLPADVSDPLR